MRRTLLDAVVVVMSVGGCDRPTTHAAPISTAAPRRGKADGRDRKGPPPDTGDGRCEGRFLPAKLDRWARSSPIWGEAGRSRRLAGMATCTACRLCHCGHIFTAIAAGRATRRQSLRRNGTRARIRVPPPGRDAIWHSPSTRFSLSRMLINPSPWLLTAASGSKPTPWSATSS